jgi:DNA-binding IclR family transcriptional regulator
VAGRTTSPGVSVSRRLLAVLDCFDGEDPWLTLTEVARRSGLPLSTARRLLGELTAWGGLERRDDGRYGIGLRLWEIGSRAPEHRGLRGAAVPRMQDLYEATQENVQLVVLDGTRALVAERIYGGRAVPTESDRGGRLALHATSAGKVLLAYSPDELLAATVDAGLVRYTPHTLVEPGRLAAAVRRVRQTGLAWSHEERVLGTVSVASPVLGPADRLVGAVAVVARVGSRVERLAPAVRAAALGISRSMSGGSAH